MSKKRRSTLEDYSESMVEAGRQTAEPDDDCDEEDKIFL
jgi:hypothetical protein